MAARLPPFSYSGLNIQTKEIRLVQLDSTPGKLELRHFPVQSCPPYITLSYTWGNPDDTSPIQVNNGRLDVTKSLLGFLEQAHCQQQILGFIWQNPTWRRHSDGTVVPPSSLKQWLWIDAICINQKDKDERNAQVPRMADIYQQCEAVIMWLGPEADNSSLAMRAIKHLADVGITDSQRMRITTPMWFNPLLLGPPDQPFSPGTWQAVEKILHRPWWTRAWVIQEATAPKPSPLQSMIWCGSQMAPWDVFGIASWGIRRLEHEDHSFSKIGNAHHDSLTCIRQARDRAVDSRDLDLIRLLGTTRYCQAFNPRDKVYALLAIASDAKHDGFQADYGKSTNDVYRDLAIHFITKQNSLEILGSSCLHSNVGNPSWVPDWTYVYKAKELCRYRDTPDGASIPTYNANLHLQDEPEFDDSRTVLRVRGFVFDTVEAVSSIDFSCQRSEQDIAKDWQRMATANGPQYVAGGTSLEAFGHVLCCDTKSADESSFERGCSADISGIDRGDFTFKEPEGVLAATRLRNLISTTRGYIGLVPPETCRGCDAHEADKICILHGSSVPLILRPTRDGQWQVVGECYVHGIMDGEAVRELGLLEGDTQMFEIR